MGRPLKTHESRNPLQPCSPASKRPKRTPSSAKHEALKVRCRVAGLRGAYSPVARLSICSRSSTWLSLQRGKRHTLLVNGTRKPHSPREPPNAGRKAYYARLPAHPPGRPPLPAQAPPLPAQVRSPPRSGPASPLSLGPDGVDVRVQLLHSGSQELEKPLGEEVAACGTRHWRPCPGHSGGTSRRHHEQPFRRERAARAAGNWSRAEVRHQGTPGSCRLGPESQRPGAGRAGRSRAAVPRRPPERRCLGGVSRPPRGWEALFWGRLSLVFCKGEKCLSRRLRFALPC